MKEMNLDNLVFYKDFRFSFESVNRWIRYFNGIEKEKELYHFRAFAKTIGYCQAIINYGFDLSKLPLKDYDAYFSERQALDIWLGEIMGELL